MVFRKTNRGTCWLKDKLTENKSDLRFVSEFRQFNHLSISNSCNTDQTAHRLAQNHKIEFITIVLASMPDH